MFLVALSEYDQVLVESDNEVNEVPAEGVKAVSCHLKSWQNTLVCVMDFFFQHRCFIDNIRFSDII